MPLLVEPGISGDGGEVLRGHPGVVPPVHADADVVVDASATVGPNVVLGKGCSIGAGAVVRESVLWECVSVGAGAVIEEAILASGVTVGPKAHIAKGSVIGHDVSIEPGAVLEPGARLGSPAEEARRLASGTFGLPRISRRVNWGPIGGGDARRHASAAGFILGLVSAPRMRDRDLYQGRGRRVRSRFWVFEPGHRDRRAGRRGAPLSARGRRPDRKDRDRESYAAAAADSSPIYPIDLVNIQHEYGLFGGERGEWLVDFMRVLEKPVVLTMHTVLPDPDETYLRVTRALCEQASKVVALSETGRGLLENVYGVDPQRLDRHPSRRPRRAVSKTPTPRRPRSASASAPSSRPSA